MWDHHTLVQITAKPTEELYTDLCFIVAISKPPCSSKSLQKPIATIRFIRSCLSSTSQNHCTVLTRFITIASMTMVAILQQQKS